MLRHSVGSGRRGDGKQRGEAPSLQPSAGQQELEVMREDLQIQLQYRTRKACLWASAALQRLAASASALAFRLEEWSVAHSLARQEAIGTLAKNLREAIEAEQPIQDLLSIKGPKGLLLLFLDKQRPNSDL